jgi:hypothetical protein
VESAAEELGRQAVSRLVSRIAQPAEAGAPLLQFVTPVLSDLGSTRQLGAPIDAQTRVGGSSNRFTTRPL